MNEMNLCDASQFGENITGLNKPNCSLDLKDNSVLWKARKPFKLTVGLNYRFWQLSSYKPCQTLLATYEV